jgi:cobaltochelatase CobS
VGKKPSFSQKQVNKMLRDQYGETVTFADLTEFYEKHNYYPFYIRKDPQYRKARGIYIVPGPDAPLSTYGPETDAKDGALVLHKQSPDVGSVKMPEIQAVRDADSDLEEEPEDKLPETTHDRIGFKYDAELSASDIQGRLKALAHQASLLTTIPEKNKAYVPFGDYEMVRTIVASKKFFPVFIAGLSGNGKTISVEQACANEKREYLRLSINTETDEDDLLGGMRLRNGETYFEIGNIVVAAIRGAVVNLDELDLASPKIMCIKPLLEGKPITIKKLGITIKPAKGFQIFATANTKGTGDETGQFVGTGLLSEALLETFPITVEQEYPSPAVERRILAKAYEEAGGTMNATSAAFFDTLAKWADAIRKTYAEQGIENVISTRRLCHIVKAYELFGDQEQALMRCTNRFNAKVKDAFLDLYNKLAPDAAAISNVGNLNDPPKFS